MAVEKRASSGKWLLWCFLLFAPFAFELVVAPFVLWREPIALWGSLYWVHTYITYGLACLLHKRWRKTIGDPISLKVEKTDIKWLFVAIAIGALAGQASNLIFYHQWYTPMIFREFSGYILRMKPMWMGIGAFVLQYFYYVMEFFLVTYIVDCAQKTSREFGWTQKVPWGGIFLALTWGLNHWITKGTAADGLGSAFLCLFLGIAYLLPGKKPAYVWAAVAAAYWLS